MNTAITSNRRSRNPVLNIVRVVFLCCAVVLANGLLAASNPPTPAISINGHVQQTNTSKPNDKSTQDKLGTDEQPIVVKSIEAEKTDKRLQQDRQESKEAAEGERRLAFWTIVVAIATSGTVAVGIGQVYMFWRQLRLMADNAADTKAVATAAKKSADAAEHGVKLARDEFIASHRPWVKCDVALAIADPATFPSAVRFDQSGMDLTLKFTMKNTGTAPALNVWPEWKIVLPGNTRDFLIDAQRRICDEIKTLERGKYANGLTIFPSETAEIVMTTNIAQPEIDAELAKEFSAKQSIKTMTVSAVGCIDYRSAIDLMHHQTGFSYYVCATQADGGKMRLGGALLPVQSNPIPMSDLFLSANFIEGHLFFAD